MRQSIHGPMSVGATAVQPEEKVMKMHMPQAQILSFRGKSPVLGSNVFLANGAQLIGDLDIGDDASIWFNTVVRADVHYIRIGNRTNIQDNTTVHVTGGLAPTIIGSDVTIGHNAIIHACVIEDLCLIGMGAKILDEARIGAESLVGAGALVTPGKIFPPRSLIIGAPARVARTLTEAELAHLRASAERYVQTARAYFP